MAVKANKRNSVVVLTVEGEQKKCGVWVVEENRGNLVVAVEGKQNACFQTHSYATFHARKQ